MEEDNIMSFMDEEGNKVQFEVVERIKLEEKEYLLLAPLDDSDDVFAFRIEKSLENGREEYIPVEDNEEFDRVNKAYDKLFE